ncbi:MAG: CehA/McbA family metallohydrolase [Pseudomonadota bacterium]
MRNLIPVLCALLLACAGGSSAAEAPDLVLRGTLTGADHQTYRRVPFTVPAGVERITISFDYGGKDQRSVIDLGMLGPDGALLGWSGGNKRLFTISSVDATPSYLPVRTVPGQWALLLGAPNIRKESRADYTAQVYFSRGLGAADEPEMLRTALRKGAAWYRGDLHSHTAHSDGSCDSNAGVAVPCPLFLTVQAAVARKLDFLAISEHNGVAHAHAMRELQPYFDKLLLMPARELTTFTGHANFFGSLAPLDFRIGPGDQADWNSVLKGAQRLHGLVSINHPVRPSGESCMGCGWENNGDMALVQAIEAVNGPDADSAWSGVPFWEKQLRRGLHPTAIGGSDDHHAAQGNGGRIGSPTTVVHAEELSQLAILAGIRAGHVFVDVAGSPDRLLEVDADSGGAHAAMGDTLAAPTGAVVRFKVHVAQAAGSVISLVLDGEAAALLADRKVDSADATRSFDWASDGKHHWLRAEVRDAGGRLLLLGNPVYLN